MRDRKFINLCFNCGPDKDVTTIIQYLKIELESNRSRDRGRFR